ncbi:ABC transporter [Spirochaetia bacterium]|nr:ABC transporter [Spirochaetia bacterium]GHU32467.1 ABC transporter [Spirochaetia bacterium]
MPNKGVQIRGIRKQFSNGYTALNGVDFDLKPGEIHALFGENGAGKSTLMHILAGFLVPTEGRISIDGKEYRFNNPSQALDAGIAMVRQSPTLTPTLPVWESCLLGAEQSFWLNRKKNRSRVAEKAAQWNFDLPLDAKTETLGPALRQKAAILALLLRTVRIFIFDEPTAVLSEPEMQQLFALFRSLRDSGNSIILISHKFEETLRLADHVSILRQGNIISRGQTSIFSPGRITDLLFGTPVHKPEFHSITPDESVVLSVHDLCVRIPGYPIVENQNFDLHPGRILACVGGRGSALDTLERTITGFLPPSSGTIMLNGRNIAGQGVRSFRDAGGAYLPSDTSARASGRSMRDNSIIHTHRRVRAGFLSTRVMNSYTQSLLSAVDLDIRASARLDSCSGGMIQRFLLARECAEPARLLVLSEPTQALDPHNRKELAKRLHEAAGAGRSVILFSTDRNESAMLADEIMEIE